MDARQEQLGAGTVLSGRYEVLSPLAQGGMGAVYEARDLVNGERVALKILRAEHAADDAMRRRFRREGAVLKALDHPGIVGLRELGVEDDGLVFLVTELVAGPSLRQRLREGSPVGLRELDRWVESLCEALQAAHTHGVIHGDLKPDNVVLVGASDASRPRLLDFGASKVLGLDRLTATGELAGTPAYMAPELFIPGGELDVRVDVYGLGVLLYELLSGHSPFQEGHVGRVIRRVAAGDYLPLDTVAEVSPGFAALVHRAMRVEPDARFARVADLLEAWQSTREREVRSR
jgi:serine/threonine protein kinase